MSRAMPSVGFSPTRWNGARKMPNCRPLWLPVCAIEILRGQQAQHGIGENRSMSPPDALPLARFTVLEVNDRAMPICLRLAASLAAKIAADLGATVLKIEAPGGDP